MEQRGSDKHGPRTDEALRGETEGLTRAGRSTRAEEWHDPEPAAEGDPEVDRVPGISLSGGTQPGLSEADVAGRSEVARFLGTDAFPASGEQLAQVAARNGAPDAVLDLLRGLPGGRRYTTVAEVWQAAGGGVEEHRT
ncbi:MAG: DUF2795 domain-containing protein [Actinomycetota bacterium]